MTFNPEDDDDVLNFVMATANLFAFVCKIEGEADKEQVKKMASKTTSKGAGAKNPFKEKYIPGEEGEETKQEKTIKTSLSPAEFKILEQQAQVLKASLNDAEFKYAEFEKDDDANHHIDFIHAG